MPTILGVKLGDSATTTHGKLQQAFGDYPISRATAFHWHKMFSEVRTIFEDEQRSGRQSAARTCDNTARVRVCAGTRDVLWWWPYFSWWINKIKLFFFSEPVSLLYCRFSYTYDKTINKDTFSIRSKIDTVRMIADVVNFIREAVRLILTEELGMWKICAKMVPRNLTWATAGRAGEGLCSTAGTSGGRPRLTGASYHWLR